MSTTTSSLLYFFDEASPLASQARLPPSLGATRDRGYGEDEGAQTSLEEELHSIPKTDFHCHLNGSISAPLLAHLEQLAVHVSRASTATGRVAHSSSSSASSDVLFFNTAAKRQHNILASSPSRTALQQNGSGNGTDRSDNVAAARMHHCFTVFDNIYKLMTNLAFTRLAVQDVLLCAAAENIVALEIRTSLRDGMTASFCFARDGATQAEASGNREPRVVSKAEYVRAVTETVAHLLGADEGVVDFHTGELTRRTSAWDADFHRIYGCLARQSKGPRDAAREKEDREKETGGNAKEDDTVTMHEVRDRTLRRVKASLHVRLQLSVNRSAGPGAAQEAVDIAAAMQRAQVHEFHSWCVRQLQVQAQQPTSTGTAAVQERMRTTCWVTGIDLSGNCYKGSFAELEPILASVAERRTHRTEKKKKDAMINEKERAVEEEEELPLSMGRTYHGGEKQDAKELAEMVGSGPERWGHLVFTDPVNLHRILSSHDAIELCITSNLLTGGHTHVGDHHLDTILDAWRDLTGTAGAEKDKPPALLDTLHDNGVYAACVHLRRERRVRRYFGADKPMPTPLSGAAAIPHISFHTDDRGVFGTTATHELALAAQHPRVHPRGLQACSPGASPEERSPVRCGMQALARLSLLSIFPLHWAVLLLALFTERHCHRNGDSRQTRATQERAEEEEGGRQRQQQHKPQPVWRALVEMERSLEEKVLSWPGFVQFVNALARTASASAFSQPLPSPPPSAAAAAAATEEEPRDEEEEAGGAFAALCAALSDMEWRWLTHHFDNAV